MRNDIREKLIQIAHFQELIGYDDLHNQLNLGFGFTLPPDRILIGYWLDELSGHEVRPGCHMLSAVVVHKEGEGLGDPGRGFCECARELGIYNI